MFIINIASFGQGITVSTSYTTDQLVNDVLMNSPCVQGYNIQSQGNCGIAYFNNTNPNFPFQEGVIIRSGIATNSAGTYTGTNLSSVCSNLGDTELSAISIANGNSGTINDASYLKFNFVTSINNLSFNFIFASNEYGIYQCSFSDVFAFILTDLNTGVSQNLAVIPNTSTPVSVTNIRDSAYNSNCSSVNPAYFSTYNVGSSNSAVNMNGFTVPLTASATVIPNNPYSIKLVVGDFNDTSFDSAVFLEANSFNIGITNPNLACNPDKIEMISFIDSNNNGVKDIGELDFNLGSFKYELNNTTTSSYVISQNGIGYIFSLDYNDTHDLSYEIDSEYSSYYTCTTNYNDVSIVVGSNVNTYYFPVINTLPYSDVSVLVSPNNSAVPGFTNTNSITYKNTGTLVANGSLTLNHSSNVTINSISEPGAVSTSTGFTFDYLNLQPLETRVIDVTYNVPTIPTVSLGDLVTTDVSISSTSTEANLSNNIFQLNKIIVGSFDPNDISEAHGEEIVYSNFSANDYLYYTIRFQNTGTANASFINVKNNLPAELNEGSIVMLHASHNYNLTRNGNQLNWFFENINLVPQSTNEEDSQGYVTFKIKPTVGYSVGTTIANTAEIYFDYNPAIITNTFVTEFVSTLNVENNSLSEFVIYPNPTNDVLNILNKENSIITKVNVIDLLGKTIFTSNYDVSNVTVDLSSLNSGIYFVEVYSNELKTVQKVIKK